MIKTVLFAMNLDHQEETMKCPHLIKRMIASCRAAGNKPYVPSLFELKEYCSTTGHQRCPFYMKAPLTPDKAVSSLA